MAMTDKTPIGLLQKKVNLLQLIGQDIIQIAIGYYNLIASKVAFSWLAYAKVLLSAVKLSYSFANYLSLNKRFVMKRNRWKIGLFLLFSAISICLSIVIPNQIVSYSDGINVRQLKLQTGNQTCYAFASNESLTDIVKVFPQYSCSIGDSASICPSFILVNLTQYSTNIQKNMATKFSRDFYYAPVYQAYMKKSRYTEKLLFELEYEPIPNLCGNSGNFYPDNFFLSNTTLTSLFSPNNTWISLSAALKMNIYLGIYRSSSFYAYYTDNQSGDTYIVTGTANARIDSKCILSE
ncbi:hypothetical protein HDV04_004885 [Boothiomyces sp. JEL0838]|nr:hypothetical protein HDV04_004885 [Boothiomyces sp. JEL0838]